MDKFQEITNLKSIKSIDVSEDAKLIYFNIAKTIDQNLLQGLEIDLESKELQLFENGDISFGVQVIESIATKQLIPIIINNGQFEKKQIHKIVNIFETSKQTGIKRKAIRKLQPKTLQIQEVSPQ